MNMTRRGHLGAMTAGLILGAVGRARAADQPIYGTWTGLLELGNSQLTLQFAIDAKGVVAISPDQGNARITADAFVIDGRHITIELKSISARFEGALADDRHIDGVFTQGGRNINLRLTRGEVAEETPEQPWPPLTPALLKAKREAAGAPAMGAAWARGTKSAILVTGSRTSEAQVAVRPQDQWHWGSITKSMTATLCARLVEAGAVRWDMTIGEVLDRGRYVVPQGFHAATLLQLLSHRASLQPNIAEKDAQTFSLHLADARAERLRYARLALAMPMTSPLGAAQVYSNNGYIVAGAMLEALTGKSWETLIQEEVFTPLGLKRAGQGAPGTQGKVDQPIGHAVAEGKRIPHPLGGPDDDNVAALGPAGRVHMPMADMLTYLAAHRDRPARFLKTASWDNLHNPHFGDDYALGWYRRRDGRLYHGGSNTLWVGMVIVDPKTGVVCAACANDAAPQTQRLVEEVAMSTRAAALL